MSNLRGKRALVMGLGVHGGGLGVARFLIGQGADVTVTDLRTPDQLQSTLDALAGLPIRYVLGEHRDQDFRAADLVVRNPGVPRESRYLQIAREAGAAIEMEMTLFFRLCPGPILGITGTKGKTTTTLLVGAMLREQYPDTVVAGNLRVSALEALPHITADTPVVLELSSWQLEGLGEARLSPRYACITNISPDHLDRYRSMDVYVAAKEEIWRHQDRHGVVVLNADDPVVAGMAERAPGRVAWFGAEAAERAEQLALRFAPARATYWQGDDLVSRRCSPSSPAEGWQAICRKAEVPLAGSHNLANVAAAAALVIEFGIEASRIRGAIRSFPGVEHRLELVRELDGVRYVNDTTATAPEAAVAALHSFDAPIVLIAGGADKTLPFDSLARAIAGRAKAVVLLAGTATPKLEAALRATTDNRRPTTDDRRPELEDRRLRIEDRGSEIEGPPSSILHPPSSEAGVVVEGPFDDFARAITEARRLAVPGDVVLLSPGCASFGMFRNEFHRGEEFRRIVHQLETGDEG